MMIFESDGLNLNKVLTFQALILSEIASLKAIERFDELMVRSIRLNDNKGYLVCVSELHSNDKVIIELFAKWRVGATTFHSKFNVTFESTKRWLRNLLLDVPDRILFLVLNCQGYPVGHMGFANVINEECSMEIDNVIRGELNQDAGLMSVAMTALVNWAHDNFSPQRIYLRTLDNNDRAICFYTKLGFKITGKQPLRRIEKCGDYNHIPLVEGDTIPPDRYFICMDIYP